MIRLRPSAIGGSTDCLHKWYQIHLMGVRSWTGYKAMRGTGVHAAAESIWTSSIKAGQKSFNLTEAKDKAAQAVDDYKDKEEVRFFELHETFDNAKDEAVAGVDVYANEIVPNVDIPMAVESFMELPLTDEITIGGTADIIHHGGTISDIKTTARKATASNYAVQLSVYARLNEVVNDQPLAPTGQIENIVYGAKDIKAHILNVKIDVDQAKRHIDDLVRRIEWWKERPNDADIAFPANTSTYLCDERYCPVYDACYLRGTKPF